MAVGKPGLDLEGVGSGVYLPTSGYVAQSKAISVVAGAGNIVLPAPGPGLVNRIWGYSSGIYGTGTNPTLSSAAPVILTITDSVAGVIAQGALTGFTSTGSIPNLFSNSFVGQLAGKPNASVTVSTTTPGAGNTLNLNIFYEVSAPRVTDVTGASSGPVLHAANNLVIPAPGAGLALYVAQMEWGVYGAGGTINQTTNPGLLTVTDSVVGGIVGYASTAGISETAGPMLNNQNDGFVWKFSSNASATFAVPDMGAGNSSFINVFYRKAAG